MERAVDHVSSNEAPRINLLSDFDVAYWCRALDVDHCELRRAVQRVGPRADAVARYLTLLREGSPHED